MPASGKAGRARFARSTCVESTNRSIVGHDREIVDVQLLVKVGWEKAQLSVL